MSDQTHFVSEIVHSQMASHSQSSGVCDESPPSSHSSLSEVSASDNSAAGATPIKVGHNDVAERLCLGLIAVPLETFDPDGEDDDAKPYIRLTVHHLRPWLFKTLLPGVTNPAASLPVTSVLDEIRETIKVPSAQRPTTG